MKRNLSVAVDVSLLEVEGLGGIAQDVTDHCIYVLFRDLLVACGITGDELVIIGRVAPLSVGIHVRTIHDVGFVLSA